MATASELAEIRQRNAMEASAAKKAAESPGELTEDDLGFLPAATIAERMRAGDLAHLGYGRSKGSSR